MKSFKFLTRLFALFGVVMLFAVSGWAGSPYFSLSHPVSVVEAAGAHMDFNITLTASPGNGCNQNTTYSVNFETTTGGTAIQNSDYTPVVAITVSITPTANENNGICGSSIIQVPILNDSVLELDETVAARLVPGTYINAQLLGTGSAAGTIIDDDAPLTISINDASIAERNTNVKVNVLLTKPAPTGGLQLNYTTSPSSPLSAVSPDDYNQTSGTIVIPENNQSYTIEIPIYDDLLTEGVETFQISISNPNPSHLISKPTAKVTIFDDESVAGGCSSYVGLMTINEYQNNPNYFDVTHNKIKGNYVELKYIDHLVKQYITDAWAVTLYSNHTDRMYWPERDLDCTDPDYEVFQYGSDAMGATAIVVLTDQNENEVDLFNLNDADTYVQRCQSFIYDTNYTTVSPADKEYFRNPDGTGIWSNEGLGANSVGSRCLNIPGSPPGVLVYKQFDAIDIDDNVIVPTRVTSSVDVPLKTKVVNEQFKVNILSLDTNSSDPNEIGTLENISTKIMVYIADGNGNGLLDPTGHLVTFNNQSYVALNDLIHTKAVKNVKFYFEFCQDSSGVLHDWNTCFEGVSNLSWKRTSYSRNRFAIRPDIFDLNVSGEPVRDNGFTVLTSGQTYTMAIHALDALAVNAVDYNQSGTNLDTIQQRYMSNGDPDSGQLSGEFNLTKNFTFTNGVSDANATLKYSDVGDVTLWVRDVNWSKVDIDDGDTPNDCNSSFHTYICGDFNTTMIPDHFELNATLFNNRSDGNFTYMSYEDDFNMSARIDLNISAMNAENNVTKNFRSGVGYYENNVTITFDIPTVDSNGSDINVSTTVKSLFSHVIAVPTMIGFDLGKRNIPWNDANATTMLRFGYSKHLDVPHNPFDVNGSSVNLDLNSTYDFALMGGSTTSILVTGETNATQFATFYYAKLRPQQQAYPPVEGVTITTPVSIAVYCDLGNILCDGYKLNTALSVIGNDPGWFLSLGHRETVGDGNVALRVEAPPLIEGAGAPTVQGATYPNPGDLTIENTNGTDANVVVTAGAGPSLPMTVGIDIYFDPIFTGRWLVHNPSSATLPPIPFYTVRFLGAPADWQGVGEVGHAVDINVSKKPTNKMDW